MVEYSKVLLIYERSTVMSVLILSTAAYYGQYNEKLATNSWIGRVVQTVS